MVLAEMSVALETNATRTLVRERCVGVFYEASSILRVSICAIGSPSHPQWRSGWSFSNRRFIPLHPHRCTRSRRKPPWLYFPHRTPSRLRHERRESSRLSSKAAPTSPQRHFPTIAPRAAVTFTAASSIVAHAFGENSYGYIMAASPRRKPFLLRQHPFAHLVTAAPLIAKAPKGGIHDSTTVRRCAMLQQKIATVAVPTLNVFEGAPPRTNAHGRIVQPTQKSS